MLSKIKSLLSDDINFSKDFSFPIIIKRSNRRTISLIVRSGKLLVRCPIFCFDKKIYNLLIKKREWINKNIDKQEQNFRILNERYFQRKIYLFKGFEKRLYLQDSSKKSINLFKEKIIISGKNLDNIKVKKLLNDWYRSYAKNYFNEKLIFFSEKMNLSFKELIIKDYKSTWGLCSVSKKTIFLNWRLVMAPESVLDYVIIHELCHLVEPNHSKSFWSQVEIYKTDYKKDKIWLKENGFLLFF